MPKLARYYIIPFETDKTKLIFDTQPKYLELLTTGSVGMIGKTLEKNGATITKFRQNYYVMKVPHETKEEFVELESKSDVISVTQDNYSKMSIIGIDTFALTAKSPDSDIQKKVCQWLVDADEDFEKKLPLKKPEEKDKTEVKPHGI